MRIAIFGANSYIAKDLILSFLKDNTNQVELDLYGRNIKEIALWLAEQSLNDRARVKEYSEFNSLTHYDAIINFVGVGNPAQAARMGALIFEVTCQYDQIILDYLQHHPESKYIFLSSGAIYGGDFIQPVTINTQAIVDINRVEMNDWYSRAKLYAEIRHRNNPQLNIVDVRVFNYFSATIDLSKSYFISDVLRSICLKEVFYTTNNNIYRDYLHPEDFYQLITCILLKDKINMALDCYTKAPIDKMTVLEKMKEIFELDYSIENDTILTTAFNFKQNYYSLNYIAETLGYSPKRSSIETLLNETELFMENLRMSLC